MGFQCCVRRGVSHGLSGRVPRVRRFHLVLLPLYRTFLYTIPWESFPNANQLSRRLLGTSSPNGDQPKGRSRCPGLLATVAGTFSFWMFDSVELLSVLSCLE